MNLSLNFWMVLFTFCLFIMILLGGLTRLTGSGLSITEWNLLSGILPPLSEEAWITLFSKYKLSPQFQKVNFSFALQDFKTIFWLEYVHRLWGRLTGLLLIIPTYKAWKKRKHLSLFFLLWGLGLGQGILGWYMVKSGLIHEPWVSPYRLTLHLMLGFLLYGLSLWITLAFLKIKPFLPTSLLRNSYSTLGLVVTALFFGGFVAGHKAGLIHNTFPLMDGDFIPPDFFCVWSQGFFSNPSNMQFMHRLTAYLTFISVCLFAYQGYHLTQSKIFLGLGAAACLQVTLGVFTLLYQVPLILGVLHQMGGCLVLSYVLAVHYFIKK